MSEGTNAPVWRSITLWIAFAILVVVSVFTVLLPELRDDDADEEAATTEQAEENSEEPDPE
ncbi:MAG: hypothetical protein AAGE52_38120 [Myxococcota bacterium]